MVAVHKITGDFFEESFILIALHSSLPEYTLVYGINNYIKTRFKKSRKDLEVSNATSFPFFEWEDVINDRYWTLISNSSSKVENAIKTDLFTDEPTVIKHHLIPEHKEIDYFLKLEEEEEHMVEELIKGLLTIPKIITAYRVDAERLKSKNNLIF